MLSVREAWNASRRAPLLSALGVITIAFSLFAFGLFALVAVNIRHALRGVEERVEVRAFVADGTPAEAIAAAMARRAIYIRDGQVEKDVRRAS